MICVLVISQNPNKYSRDGHQMTKCWETESFGIFSLKQMLDTWLQLGQQIESDLVI